MVLGRIAPQRSLSFESRCMPFHGGIAVRLLYTHTAGPLVCEAWVRDA